MSVKEDKDTAREDLVLEQDIIYEIGLDSKVISWNRGAELLYGWDSNEAVGKTAYEVFKTEFHLNMYDFITETVKNYIWTGELSQFKRDGSKIIVSSHAILRRSGDGKPSGIIFVNTDITKIKNAAELLGQKEELISITLSSIGDGVLATDIDGRITLLNPVAEALTGWTMAEALGKPADKVFNIISHATRKSVVLPVEETLKKGRIVGLSNHTILVARNGSERHIADSCAPIRNRDGQVVGAVLVFRDVTERVEKDLTLEKTRMELAAVKILEDESREYSENIINTVRESLIVLDQDLRVLSASRSFYEVFKVKPGETVGKLIFDLGNKQWDIPKLRSLLETILREKTPFDNYEVVHEFASIGTRTMLLNARLVQRALGKERIILLAIEDVTVRMNAELVMKKFNRTLRAISNTNQALMQEIDEQNFLDKVCAIIVNDCGVKLAWIGFTENSAGNIITAAKFGASEGYMEKIHTGRVNPDAGKYPSARAILTGKTVVCQNMQADPRFDPWRKETARNGFMSMIALPLRSVKNILGALMIYSDEKDAFPESEVKLLEELAYDVSFGIMLIRARGENTAAEFEIKKIAAFPKLNPNPISEIDQAGKLYYINPAFMKIFPNQARYSLSHPWFGGIVAIFKELKGGKKKVLARDIKVFDRYYMQTLVYIPAEGTIRTYGIDITKRVEAENELQRLNKGMENTIQRRTSELLASKHLADIGLLAATVAHELRNPLGVINLASFNMREETRNKNMLLHLSIIEKKVAESDRIINDLLVYSRMKVPQFERTDIYALLTDCINGIKKQFHGKKIRLLSSLAPVKKLLIGADPAQLREVFTNIITNAFQAIERGKGIVTVKAFLKTGGKIGISIKDTGLGIKKEDMARIFKPFFSLKTKGTGLGLVISRDIVTMHNGSIDIASTPGKGSTFTVTLPVRIS